MPTNTTNTEDLQVLNCNVGPIYRKRILALAKISNCTITKVMKLAITSAKPELMLTDQQENDLLYEETHAGDLSGYSRNINCKISAALHNKVHNFARKRRMTLSNAVRLLIDYEYCRAEEQNKITAGFPERPKKETTFEADRTYDMNA